MNLGEIYLRTVEMDLEHPLSFVFGCELWLNTTYNNIQRYVKDIFKIVVHTGSLSEHTTFWNPDYVPKLHDSR